ncbi:MAG: class I SAM-dependent methyltransferase [Saprospiraceae bacterium]|nr:class I SAM-dependent methyltransferase [Saprospiraceae bacterium]
MKKDLPIDYVSINKKSWNERTAIHLTSDFYDNESFIQSNRNSLNTIELDLLGDLSNQSALHLQCHFGQDTISLERLGATTAIGVDLSDEAIKAAQMLAQQTQSKAKFICCDLYDLPQHLDQEFDLVFSSYGTIGWLPDLDKWAQLIHKSLKKNGRFVFAEFHPVVWMFDDNFTHIKHNYFKELPILEETETYTDSHTEVIKHQSVNWNHSLGEVLSSLLKVGLQLEFFQEYDYSPYTCFDHVKEVAPGKFCIPHIGQKIPMVYALVARKTY